MKDEIRNDECGMMNDENEIMIDQKDRALASSIVGHVKALHFHPSSFILRNSHALAARQSRRTVITEISNTSAVSSRLKPPK